MAAKKSARKGAKKSSAKKSSAKKSAKKGAKKSSAKKSSARKKTAKRSGAKRTPNAAFMKPMQPDAQLAAVVGNSPMPRTEITKKLWAYIKRKGLQDAKNRRQINADENLKPVFGGKSNVSMFEMTKLVNKHIK
jgi:upstream activation factor subunit UAF30